jgi:hypothetical protein
MGSGDIIKVNNLVCWFVGSDSTSCVLLSVKNLVLQAGISFIGWYDYVLEFSRDSVVEIASWAVRRTSKCVCNDLEFDSCLWIKRVGSISESIPVFDDITASEAELEETTVFIEVDVTTGISDV